MAAVLSERLAGQLIEGMACSQQRDTSPSPDAFGDSGARRMQRVLDARLLLLHLALGGCADLDQRDTARKSCRPFLELLAIVVAGGFVDRRLDLLDARLDRSGVPALPISVVLSLSISIRCARPRSASVAFSS